MTIQGVKIHFPCTDKRCTVRILSRGGTKSPEMWVIEDNGQRFYPIHQRVMGIEFSGDGFLQMIYGRPGVLDALLPKCHLNEIGHHKKPARAR